MKDKQFKWEGISENGKRSSGIAFAKNNTEVKTFLEKKNIIPIAISAVKTNIFYKTRSITKKHVTSFTQQLKLLIDAKISLINSLSIIEKSKNIHVSNLAQLLKKSIASGKSFSEALKENGDVFNSFYISLIIASEKTAKLPAALNAIIQHLETIDELKQLTKKAMIYPLLILIVSIIIFGLMITFVIPQFNTIYSNLDIKLPRITQALLLLSSTIKHHSLHIFIILTILFFIFYFSQTLRLKINSFLLQLIIKFPIFKTYYQYQFTAHWSKLLSIMIKSEVPLLTALRQSVNMFTLFHETHQIQKIIMKISAGSSLSNAMKHSKNLFPNQAIYLITIAESAGNLPFMLEKIANIYYESVKNISNNLCKLLEPVIIILLSIIIGMILLAMYLPIFNINSLI